MYRFIIKKPAKKFIDGLPINERLPDSGDIKPLQGKKNQGVLRLRVGKYRVIYTVDEGQFIVFIIDAGNRGQIYSRY